MDTYKLGMSSNGKKFYIKSIGEYKAMGSGKASAELIDVFKGVEGFGELDQFKAAKNKLQTASKPELATASKPGDTNVDKIFVGDETLNRLPEKYRGVFAPMGKDGKILHPSSAHSGEYFKQSVNENTALDSTIEALKGEEKAGTISPNMRVALEGHKERMVEMRDKFDSIKDPKERASEVAKSYATLFQQMHKADSDMGGSMIKNMAEMALYDTEIAAEQEAYLPSAGTFPSGDKLRVDRGGKGKVEKVASVSVKYGKSGQFYGFPGQTDKYANYHPDPDYRNRQANRAGRKGYETGIRDDLIDDPKKFQKMVDESGYGEAIKNPKEVQAIAKEMQDYFREIKKTKGITSETSITLKTIEKDVYSKNAELMIDRLIEIIDYFKPTYWFIENPRGQLQYYPPMIELEKNNYKMLVYYGNHGVGFPKATHIWSNVKLWENEKTPIMAEDTYVLRWHKFNKSMRRYYKAYSFQSAKTRSLVPSILLTKIYDKVELYENK